MNRLQITLWTVALLLGVAFISDRSSQRAIKRATRRVERLANDIVEQNRRDKELIGEVMKTVKGAVNANQAGFINRA